MADENTFSQEQVNGLVGTARTEGRTAAQKELLKALGFETVEAGQEFVKVSRSAQKDFDTKLGAMTVERDGAVVKYKTISLEQKAAEVGAELGLSPAKAKQVTRLLEIPAATFDPETNTLKADFEKFLAEPDNKHFVTAEPEVKPGSNRKPGQQKTGEPDKFDQLLGQLRF